MASRASGFLRGERSGEELLRTAQDMTCDPVADEVTLPCWPEAAGAVRRLTRLQLHSRWALAPAVTDDAEILASELVTNVLDHAGAGTFGFRFRRRRGWVRAEVRDPSRALPCVLPLPTANPLVGGGRGLVIVNELADRWGVDLLPFGKSTWFELRAAGR